MDELEDVLINELNKDLVLKGFEYSPYNFLKPFEKGLKSIYPQIAEYDWGISVAIWVSVRFSDVEELANEFSHHLSDEDKQYTATIGLELGLLSRFRRQRRSWLLSSVEEVVKSCPKMIKLIEKIGIPYLERFSDLHEVLKVLSAKTKTVLRYAALDNAKSAKRALASAYLLDDREAFENIIKLKVSQIEKIDKVNLPDFLDMANSLRRRWGLD